MKNLLIIPDWKTVIRTAYSVWFAFAALLILHASDFIYSRWEIDTNPESWTWILTWFLIAVIVSRFIPQPKKHKWKRRGLVLIFFLIVCGLNVPAMAAEPGDYQQKKQTSQPSFDEIAFTLISRWEGLENHAYQDIVGVWTICYGHTKTARSGQFKTDAECRALLVTEIHEYRDDILPCFSAETIQYRMHDWRLTAYTSLGFNVGPERACRSTAMRRVNRGDVEGGCEALTWWNRAGGRVVRGLVNRRADEKEYCLREVGS